MKLDRNMTLMRKMLQRFKLPAVCLFALAAWSQSASAGTPKLDKDTCTQLRGEQANFVQTGILADVQRGPEWAKSNLAAPRLRDIEHFIALDEQLKFGCREATLTPEAMRAGEEALKIEANPDSDPNAPAAASPTSPASAGTASPPADASGVNAAPGDAGATPPAEADAPKAPAKPRVRHKPTAHPKPKPSKDAFTPPPGTESTLQPPAPTEQTPKAPAVEAR